MLRAAVLLLVVVAQDAPCIERSLERWSDVDTEPFGNDFDPERVVQAACANASSALPRALRPKLCTAGGAARWPQCVRLELAI